MKPPWGLWAVLRPVRSHHFSLQTASLCLLSFSKDLFLYSCIFQTYSKLPVFASLKECSCCNKKVKHFKKRNVKEISRKKGGWGSTLHDRAWGSTLMPRVCPRHRAEEIWVLHEVHQVSCPVAGAQRPGGVLEEYFIFMICLIFNARIAQWSRGLGSEFWVLCLLLCGLVQVSRKEVLQGQAGRPMDCSTLVNEREQSRTKVASSSV